MANILIVSQYFWPEEFRINSVVAELSRKGHHVTVLTGSPNYPSGQIDKDYLENKGKYGVYHQSKIYRVPMLRRGSNYFSLALNYLSFFISASLLGPLFLRGVKVDVVIVYQLSPATVLMPGYIIARVKNSKYIPWIQDLWPEAVPMLERRALRPLSFAIRKFVDFFLKNADFVICQSRSFITALNSRGVSRSKLKFIPNWAEESYLRTVLKFAPQIEIDDSFFTIMFAGNLGVAQDLPNVLKAIDLVAKKDNNVRWMFVGDGRILPWMSGQVKELGLDDKVQFLGRFPVEAMPDFFSHADAMLISLLDKPIYGKTIPSKLQSYFMAGKPILGMLPGEGAAVLKTSKSGICVDAADYIGLSEAVLTMASLSKDSLTEMSLNSRQFGIDNYSEEKLMSELEELFA